MRWTLGDYTLKYNPNTLSKSWNVQDDIIVNANGEISNPNLIYNGTQSFSISVYDPPTYTTSSSIQGSYIGISEDRLNNEIVLLKTGGSFDVKQKDGTLAGTHTIVSGNGISLPSTNPSSVVVTDSVLAFMYKETNQASLLLTDQNGVANRKYIYSSDDLKNAEYISWDFGSNYIALNPYGKLYSIDTSSGTETFLYQFGDFNTNTSNSFKRYTSVTVYQKSGKLFIGVLVDTKDLIFIDYEKLDIVCKSETGLGNILGISYSNYSGDSFCLFGDKINKIYLNTARLDINFLKNALSSGQVTINDEQGFPYVLSTKSMNVTREYNKNEARYEVQIEGSIIYNNTGFGNVWTKNSRSL